MRRRPRLAVVCASMEGLGGCLWIWTKAVCSSSAVLSEEHDEYDCANQWDESDEKPPAATIGIVESSDAYRERRYQQCERENGSKKANARLWVKGSSNPVNESECDVDDEIEQYEVPVFATTGPSRENCVLLECGSEPVHVPSQSCWLRLVSIAGNCWRESAIECFFSPIGLKIVIWIAILAKLAPDGKLLPQTECDRTTSSKASP